jgi:hypothetical protein
MKSNRSKARQNLLVSTANTALERGLITLACESVAEAAFEYELAGLPIVAHCRDIGFDEISMHAICCPTERGRAGSTYCGYAWRVWRGRRHGIPGTAHRQIFSIHRQLPRIERGDCQTCIGHGLALGVWHEADEAWLRFLSRMRARVRQVAVGAVSVVSDSPLLPTTSPLARVRSVDKNKFQKQGYEWFMGGRGFSLTSPTTLTRPPAVPVARLIFVRDKSWPRFRFPLHPPSRASERQLSFFVPGASIRKTRIETDVTGAQPVATLPIMLALTAY